jgi:hypothetical protein
MRTTLDMTSRAAVDRAIFPFGMLADMLNSHSTPEWRTLDKKRQPEPGAGVKLSVITSQCRPMIRRF